MFAQSGSWVGLRELSLLHDPARFMTRREIPASRKNLAAREDRDAENNKVDYAVCILSPLKREFIPQTV